MKTAARGKLATVGKHLTRFLPAILAVLVLALAATLYAVTHPEDDRPHAKVGAVYSHPHNLKAPEHVGQIFLPWSDLDVAVGTPEEELPDLWGARANLQAPDGGSFVQVGTKFHTPRPLAAVAAPFSTKVGVVLRADGKDYPLSGSDRPLLDPNQPNEDENYWVAVEGHPKDIEVRVSFAGQTQVVSADGSVERAGAADLERSPTFKEVRAFNDVPCGAPRTVGNSPLEISYRDELECMVTLVARTPYVDGLGWAEPGREFLLVEVKMPSTISVTSADQPTEHYWEQMRHTLSATLGGEPTAADPANGDSLPLGIMRNGGGTQFIYEVERDTPAGEFRLTDKLRATLSDPFDPRTADLTIAWTVPARKLA